VSGEVAGRPCGAELHHTHGTAVCDLPNGHDGQHGAWCGICLDDDGYDDPSDRLEWEHDGENWLTRR
jgi:hypothetical protein